MKFMRITALTAATMLACTAPVAMAQSSQPIELIGDVKVDKVVIENGKENHVFSGPSVVVPGDQLVFSTSYRNTGKQPVNDFEVTNPLPASVMLSPEGADVHTVSVDGGKTWGKLSGLTVSDGQGGKRPATASDVTHLRWTLAAIAPGATGKLTYHAIVR
jgi:uncharacterized repeat protein (TIGR01451 family)